MSFKHHNQNHIEKFLPLSDYEESIGNAVVNSAYKVHKELGPGLLEKVYETCLCYVLEKDGYFVKRQVDIPIVFENMKLNDGLRLDVLVNDLVICELKAIETVNPVWEAQFKPFKVKWKKIGIHY